MQLADDDCLYHVAEESDVQPTQAGRKLILCFWSSFCSFHAWVQFDEAPTTA